MREKLTRIRSAGFLLILALLVLLFSYGCRTGAQKTAAANTAVSEMKKELRAAYFYDYKKALQLAGNIINIMPDDQTAAFVLGEHEYLRGRQNSGFSYLLSALTGPDDDLALAAMSVIREMYISRSMADALIDAVPLCKNAVCRGLIELEGYDWALATGNVPNFDPASVGISGLDRFTVFRSPVKKGFSSVSKESEIEKQYISKTAFFPESARKIAAPWAGYTINLRNYFGSVKNDVFYIYSSFTTARKKELEAVADISVPFRLFVDGKIVLENNSQDSGKGLISGRVKLILSEGSHSVLLKVAPYLAETVQARVIFFGDSKDAVLTIGDNFVPQTGSAEVADALIQDASDSFSQFVRLISEELLFGAAGYEKWEKFYSSITGSKNPAILYRLGKAYQADGNEQDFLNLLNSILTERKNLALVRAELMDYYLNKNEEKEVKQLIASADSDEMKSLPYLLRLNDYYFFKKWLKPDNETSRLISELYPDSPISYIYLSDSAMSMGNIRMAIENRELILNFMPYYYPVLSSLRDFYQKTGDSFSLESVLGAMLKNDPHNTDIIGELGDEYFSDHSFDEALEYYRLASAYNPEAAEIYSKIGDINTFKNDNAAALLNYRKAYELKPEDESISGKLDMLSDGDNSGFFVKYALSDEKVDAKISESKKVEDGKYVVVYDEGLQKIFYNGTVKSRFRMVVRLLNEEGVREFSAINNTGNVVRARVIKTDGSIKSNWKADSGFLYFSDLEKGDVIDYTFETTDKVNSWLNGVDFKWFFAVEGVYNLHSRITLLFPPDMKATFYKRGEPAETTEVTPEGRVYVFETKDRFMPPREESMPSIIDFLPLMSYSTVSDWSDFAQWQAVFIKEQSAESGDIKKAVSALTEGAVQPEEKIKRLRDFAARDIRYLFNDKGIYKIKPEKTDKTFRDKMGDCKDKSLLLKFMLEKAGITAYYSLVKTAMNGRLIEEIPYMQFDHALVYIPVQDGVAEGFFVDATSSYDHYRGINPAIEGARAMVIKDDTGEFSFMTVSSGNENRIDWIMQEDGEVLLNFYGIAASYARYRFVSDQDKYNHVSSIIGKLALMPSEISELKLEGNIYDEPLRFKLRSSEFFPAIASYSLGKIVSERKRNYPVVIADKVLDYNFRIKKNGIKIADFKFDGDFFSYEIKTSENFVDISYKIKKKLFIEKDFPKLKDDISKIMELENKYRK